MQLHALTRNQQCPKYFREHVRQFPKEWLAVEAAYCGWRTEALKTTRRGLSPSYWRCPRLGPSCARDSTTISLGPTRAFTFSPTLTLSDNFPRSRIANDPGPVAIATYRSPATITRPDHVALDFC
jgi:hypothetical protein